MIEKYQLKGKLSIINGKHYHNVFESTFQSLVFDCFVPLLKEQGLQFDRPFLDFTVHYKSRIVSSTLKTPIFVKLQKRDQSLETKKRR